MAMPAGKLVRLVWGGPVTDSDIWQTGCWWKTDHDVTQAELDEVTSDSIASLTTSFWAVSGSPGWRNQVSASTKLRDAKGYYYVNGELTLQSAHSQSAAPGASDVVLPPYVAAVFTTRTARFGRSYRGRMYWPANGAPINGGSGLFSGMGQENATNLATVIGNILGAGAPFTGRPVVVSNTKAQATEITTVSLDNKPDTQRGRQNRDTATTTWSSAVGT